MPKAWGTELIQRVPGSHPGLYLVRTDPAARLAGKDQLESARRAGALAATVIQHPGAIVREDVLPRRSS